MRNGRFGLSKEEITAGSNEVQPILSGLFHRKPGLHPSLLPLGIMRNIRVAHGRQFTGGVFAGVSMRVAAVGDDLNVLVGKQLGRKLFDFVGRNIQGSSGNVGFPGSGLALAVSTTTLTFSLRVELGLQIFRRNSRFHRTSLRNNYLKSGSPDTWPSRYQRHHQV